ncbi:hypothetical protein DU508_09020 [Pedobacter chinensis]|uniref:N-acetylmuramoyl-L-alanine amidase n=1 Tax=Pedobacter chinensis TaxID=2282421 RepID=A0A369PYG5_9SPHI|nr:hypothetical protein [Pedobacter chinensis]RDC57302.1 hypothetical protein DU508_09020 [Pedobacter chinensis]
MLKVALSIILICFSLLVKAQHPPVFPAMTTDSSFIKIANLNISLVKYSYKPNGVRFLVVHDNEDTGVKAGFEYIRWSGGELIDSQYGGVRDYTFNYMSDPYRIDPNAIYTQIGVSTRLKKDAYSSNEVEKLILNAGKQILDFYDPKSTGYILTLHNNADGGFGISSYLPGYELSSTADSVYINFQMDGDDLLYVTEPRLFTSLKKANVNVILQSKFAENDGSLSVYAMQNNIPYINVEVQHGHLDENLRLIEIAIAALKEHGLIKNEGKALQKDNLGKTPTQ